MVKSSTSCEDKSETADIIRNLSVKGDIDIKFWDELKKKFKGSIPQKKEAIDAFFSRYKNIPYEADEYILELAKSDKPVEMVRLIANYYADEKIRISWKLDYQLLATLRENEDHEVMKLISDRIKDRDERRKKLKKALNSFTENYRKAFVPFIQFQKQMELSYLPIQQMLKDYNDSVRIINKTFTSFYKPSTILDMKIPETIPRETTEYKLMNNLSGCPKGEKGWKSYQDICGEIISYLFVPPLGEPSPQDRSDDGVHIRDYLLQIPCDIRNFWNFCQMKYDSVCLVVEIKNKNRLTPNDVVITAKYLHSKRTGNFGILLSRDKPETNVLYEVERIWKEEDKLMVLLTDDDLINMIKLKQSGDEPEKLIENWIFKFRSKLD